MNDEVRESKSIKMRPSVVKKARIEAVTSNKTLGEWLEEAIEEKIAREEKKVK
jgi:predicted HicB family RNase H-like nuclease